jgi:hypothetical protein
MNAKYSVWIASVLLALFVPCSAAALDVLTSKDSTDWARTAGRLGVTLKAAKVESNGRSHFAAQVLKIDRASSLVGSGAQVSDHVVSVNGFRFEDMETMTKYIASLGPSAPLKVALVDQAGLRPRIITTKLVDAARLTGQPHEDPQKATITSTRESEAVTRLEAHLKRQEVKGQCEKEALRAIPNAVGGAVGGKVGLKVGALGCAPFLATVMFGDPGLVYAACVLVVGGIGTGTGVAIANASTDNKVEVCANQKLAATN